MTFAGNRCSSKFSGKIAAMAIAVVLIVFCFIADSLLDEVHSGGIRNKRRLPSKHAVLCNGTRAMQIEADHVYMYKATANLSDLTELHKVHHVEESLNTVLSTSSAVAITSALTLLSVVAAVVRNKCFRSRHQEPLQHENTPALEIRIESINGVVSANSNVFGLHKLKLLSKEDSLESADRSSVNHFISHQYPMSLDRFSSYGHLRSSCLLSRAAVLLITFLSVMSLVMADCLPEPYVIILITMPSALNMHEAKVFQKDRIRNEVSANEWSQENRTKFQIFDDDECSRDKNICGPGSICENLRGSYLCQCQNGFYYDGKSCQACSRWCPEDFFESIPCSASRDRICSPCAVCSRHEFEARSCLPLQNRLCLHVAYPLLMFGSRDLATFLQGMNKPLPLNKRRKRLRIDASHNVFFENLHSARHMETLYYITATKQLTDFFWFRDSGVRINIGLQNVNLIPVYEDVDHDSDNEFIMGRPEMGEEKKHFTGIVKNHCRNPVPDYYSVALEIIRERTTQAWLDVCTLEKQERGICPKSVVMGEQYLHRTLNKSCEKMIPKMGTYPAPFEVVTNSIVCTDASDTLLRLFNVTSGKIQKMTFPSKDCKTSYSRCDKCLQVDQCQVNDLFEQYCCQIDCYHLPECKLSSSKRCENFPIECASGDAFRYTLQPVFKNLKHEFRCHVKLSRPQVLYQVWFYVSVTSAGFETPRVFHQLHSDDVNNFTNGHYDMEFLTIEHSTGVKLWNELLLTGSRHGDVWNYFVTVVNEEEPPQQQDAAQFSSNYFAPNLHVINTQFTVPFAYSTSSWVSGKNHCQKDVNKFRPVDWKYGNWSQAMNVIAQTGRTPYSYGLKSIDNPPHLKFIIPANASVLRWWFQGQNASLIMNDQFHSSLTLSADERIWEIQLSGHLRECPGYLSVTINDRMEMEEVFKYDALVSCPPEFNLTFNIPNWGVKLEKTFDVVLHDGTHTHSIFLTNLLFDDSSSTCRTLSETLSRIDYPTLHNSVDSLMIVLPIMVFLVLIACLIFWTYTAFCQNVPKKLDCNQVWLQTKVMRSHDNLISRITVYLERFRCLNKLQKVILVLYLISHLIYCLIMTFTVISLLLAESVHDQTATIATFQDAQNKILVLSNDTLLSLDHHTSEDLHRQLTMIDNMQKTCNAYTDDISKLLWIKLNKIFGIENLSELCFGPNSFTERIIGNLNTTVNEFVQNVDTFMFQYILKKESTVQPIIFQYNAYIQNITSSSWMIYPKSLFNKTSWWLNETDYGMLLKNHPHYEPLLKDELAFSSFLNLHQVESVNLWSMNFAQRMKQDMQLFMSAVNFQLPKYIVCNSDRSLENRKHFAGNVSVHSKMNSYRFFTSGVFNSSSSSSWLKDIFRNRQLLNDQHDLLLNEKSFMDIFPLEVDEVTKCGFVQDKPHCSYFIDIKDRQRQHQELNAVSWFMLKIIFLTLDIIMLVFRLSHICINIQKMCNGFEEVVTLELTDVDWKYSAPAPIQVEAEMLPSTTNCVQNHSNSNNSITELADKKSFAESLKDVSHAFGSNHFRPDKALSSRQHNRVSTTLPLFRKTSDFDFSARPITKGSVVANRKLRISNYADILRLLWKGILKSEIIPVFIIMAMLLLGASLSTKFMELILNPVLLLNFNGFLATMQILTVHVNSTNDYLGTVANLYTGDMSSYYAKHMVYELSFLQGISELYLAGMNKKHKFGYDVNLNKASCSNQSLQKTDEWHISMLPCNYVPVQSKAFSECRLATHVQELLDEFNNIFRSTSILFVAFFQIILISFSVVILASAAEKLFFHIIKTWQHFPSCFSYVTTWHTYATSYPPLPRKATGSGMVVSILPGHLSAKTIQTVYCEHELDQEENSINWHRSTLKYEFPASLFSETKV